MQEGRVAVNSGSLGGNQQEPASPVKDLPPIPKLAGEIRSPVGAVEDDQCAGAGQPIQGDTDLCLLLVGAFEHIPEIEVESG